MKVKKISLLFFLLFSLNIDAQIKEIYVPAKIKLLNGITLTGYVKASDISKTSIGVQFKAFLKDNNTFQISSNEILQLFKNETEEYEQLSVKVGQEEKNKFVLAQKLVEGQANLYKFQLFGKEYYTIAMPDSSYLLQNDEIRSGGLVKYYFRIALKNALGVENQDVESVRFSFLQNDFVKIVSSYNLKNTSKNRVLKDYISKENFMLSFLGGRPKGDQNEFYGQVIYRTYFPSISEKHLCEFWF